MESLTYRFYLLGGGHIKGVEAITCRPDAFADNCARLLEKHPAFSAVEVWDGPNRIFSLHRPAAPAP